MLALAFCLCLLQKPVPGESLDSLIKRIPEVTVSRDRGIGDEQEDLARRIQAYEARAIPPLLSFLDDPDEIVRGFVGYVLRDIRGLEEKHLDVLIHAFRSGNGWIPPAIAHIGTPRAITFLVEDLQTHPEIHTQVTWALSSMGEPAALALAASFRSDTPLGAEYAGCASFVFKEMHEHAGAALDPLLEVARGQRFPLTNRKLAIEAIGALGLQARGAIHELEQLAASDSGAFTESVEQAILGIGSPEAALILARSLAAGPSVYTLRDIAALGENGLEAGPEVLRAFGSLRPDVRVSAARALGYIGFRASVEALVRETSQADDWQLACACVEALGRLRAEHAIPALIRAAASYWYPPVRSAAKKSLAVIRGTSGYVSRFHPSNFAFEFFDDMSVERGTRRSTGMGQLVPGADELTRIELEAHPYSIRREGYRLARGARDTAKPGCGLRVPGGLLLGATRGEWGGEVVYLKSDGKQEPVLWENTIGLHRTPSGIVAVTGLAHLTIEEGVLYRIDLGADGSYKATWWKRLPGEPSRSGLRADGTLIVSCRGGTIAVSADGRIGMASEH